MNTWTVLKRITVFVLSAVLLTMPLVQTVSAEYCEGELSSNAKIILQDAPLELAGSTFVLSNEIYVPITEFLSRMGIYSSWNSHSNQLIAFDNNIFLCLKQNLFLIRLNGRAEMTKLPIALFNGELYAPASMLLSAFEIDYTQQGNTLNIRHRAALNEYITRDHERYRRFSLLKHGITLYVPAHFEYSDGVFIDEKLGGVLRIRDKSEFEIPSQLLPEHLDGFNRYEIVDAFGDVTRYYIPEKGNYILEFSHFQKHQEDIIVSSVNANKLQPMLDFEHYFEYPQFHMLHAELESPIYSNMLGEDYIPFKGTVDAPGRMRIVVTKGKDVYQRYVDCSEGAFEAKIYMPFGIGKHNVAVYYTEAEGDEKPFLIFSALNTSGNSLKNVMATEYMNIDSDSVRIALLRMGHEGINQKASAEKIYCWILDNYSLDPGSTEVKKLTEILAMKDKKISEVSCCILYAGMLRSAGIPAKICTNRKEKRCWVDVYLNGSWRSMLIVEDLKNDSFLYFFLPQIQDSEELDY